MKILFSIFVLFAVLAAVNSSHISETQEVEGRGFSGSSDVMFSNVFLSGKGSWKKTPTARCCVDPVKLRAYMDNKIKEDGLSYLTLIATLL